MNNQNTSLFWKRFKRNKMALGSIVFIVSLVLIGIFAYPLSPDDSPDANMMTIEIGTKQPGFHCLFFKKYKETTAVETFWIKYILYGKEKNYELIPIKSFAIVNEKIVVEKIVDEVLTETISFAISKKNNPLSQKELENTYITQRTFWLGTDKYGRDMLSRLLLGTRVSLAVGFIAVIISIFIGVLLGALSGYFGGWTDQFISWLINIVWAIPTLLLVFAITFALGKGFWQIFIAVGLTMWVGTARLIRGQVMSLKELEYIQAAKTMGFSSYRIIVKHILPNILGPTVVMAASNFATAILIEAGLSFLGIGVQPPVSSWGLMIKENYNFIITNRPLLAIIPGIAIMLVVLAFNILGNALRDALDVKGN